MLRFVQVAAAWLVSDAAVDARGHALPTVLEVAKEKLDAGQITAAEYEHMVQQNRAQQRDLDNTLIRDPPAPKTFRVVLAGDSLAGKSTCYQTMLGRQALATMDVETTPTQPADVVPLVYNTEEGEPTGVKLALWDTGGNDRNRIVYQHPLSPFKRADAVVLMYADTDRETFTHLTQPHEAIVLGAGQTVSSWLKFIEETSAAPPNPPALVLAAHTPRGRASQPGHPVRRASSMLEPVVELSEAQGLAAELDLPQQEVLETGCRDQASVDAILDQVVMAALRRAGGEKELKLAEAVARGQTRWRA